MRLWNSSGRSRLLRTPSQWTAVVACVLLGVMLFALVDLTPQIEEDFFFSTDDPQLSGSRTIGREFGAALRSSLQHALSSCSRLATCGGFAASPTISLAYLVLWMSGP
jgi:hypothetical protein